MRPQASFESQPTNYCCPNCGGSSPNTLYCPSCGQKRVEGRYNWKDLWQEIFNKFLGLEQGILHTIVDVSLKPGRTSRAYLEGRRKQYTPPLSFFVFCIAIYMLLLQYTGIEEVTEQAMRMGMEQPFGVKLEELPQEQQEELLSALAVRQNLLKYIKVFNFIMLPFHALGWWLMTRKKFQYSWLEIIIVSFFMQAVILLAQTIMHVPLVIWQDPSLLTLISACTSIFGLIYTFIFAKRFYQLSWWNTLLVFLVGELFGILAILIPAMTYGVINAITNHVP